jgi:predicted RNase H-like HicB family nuclease
MKYPLYVNRVSTTQLHAHFPDFPRVDLIGSSRAEIELNAQRVIEQAYDGSDQPISAPTSDTELRALRADGSDGLWVFVDIDLARVSSTAVELRFNILDTLLDRVDAAATEHHMTRAAFFSRAAMHELEENRASRIAQTPSSLAKSFISILGANYDRRSSQP